MDRFAKCEIWTAPCEDAIAGCGILSLDRAVAMSSASTSPVGLGVVSEILLWATFALGGTSMGTCPDRIFSTRFHASTALPSRSCRYNSSRLLLFVRSCATSDFNAAVRVKPGRDWNVHVESLCTHARHTGLTPSHLEASTSEHRYCWNEANSRGSSSVYTRRKQPMRGCRVFALPLCLGSCVAAALLAAILAASCSSSASG